MASQSDINRPPGTSSASQAFFDHASAKCVSTDAVITKALNKQYPNLELIVVPTYSLNLWGYAAAGFATAEPIEDAGSDLPSGIQWDMYIPPAKRLNGGQGFIVDVPKFAKYLYKWRNDDFIIYYIECRDGVFPDGPINWYILSTNKLKTQQLILEAGYWSNQLHSEAWVFDGGYWQKSTEMYESVQKASWDVVILDPKMKNAIIEDHLSFFRSREAYEHLRVPWKRGIIYHGPPGNGKTISIKATMNMLSKLDPSVQSLYVRTLQSWSGPEFSIQQIFSHARSCAPCYLIFEDLDSIIDDSVRSYFLNEVDGLKDNDGVFMIGSTNHLERLDPGISKRPSRFDRKYYFPNPNLGERTAYCHFWQKKLSDNKDIEFPDALCRAIAEITDKFSFAYIQEAFVASLLAIARRSEDAALADAACTLDLDDGWVDVLDSAHTAKDLDKLVLWVEMQKQVAILREGLEDEEQ
ncbi:P-loop containing nucleoside triphosphate hydrolase protein [Stachybotrys elegans]|uniref:P-loop containing nucleoside triphosphate hydrolase protein n=1 Tax=Stachybotrys elegans TaxID=80388 RepID=A0A8K0T3N6_9HYPO|nr:P-loop containing nucleoside triphosphate hydrolase protein [Stachybotrys elegans]